MSRTHDLYDLAWSLEVLYLGTSVSLGMSIIVLRIRWFEEIHPFRVCDYWLLLTMARGDGIRTSGIFLLVTGDQKNGLYAQVYAVHNPVWSPWNHVSKLHAPHVGPL